jgi:hypothetical protein
VKDIIYITEREIKGSGWLLFVFLEKPLHEVCLIRIALALLFYKCRVLLVCAILALNVQICVISISGPTPRGTVKIDKHKNIVLLCVIVDCHTSYQSTSHIDDARSNANFKRLGMVH